MAKAAPVRSDTPGHHAGDSKTSARRQHESQKPPPHRRHRLQLQSSTPCAPPGTSRRVPQQARILPAVTQPRRLLHPATSRITGTRSALFQQLSRGAYHVGNHNHIVLTGRFVLNNAQQPARVIDLVARYLDFQSLIRLQQVCRTLHNTIDPRRIASPYAMSAFLNHAERTFKRYRPIGQSSWRSGVTKRVGVSKADGNGWSSEHSRSASASAVVQKPAAVVVSAGTPPLGCHICFRMLAARCFVDEVAGQPTRRPKTRAWTTEGATTETRGLTTEGVTTETRASKTDGATTETREGATTATTTATTTAWPIATTPIATLISTSHLRQRKQHARHNHHLARLRRFCLSCGIANGWYRTGRLYEAKTHDRRGWVCECGRWRELPGETQCEDCGALMPMSAPA